MRSGKAVYGSELDAADTSGKNVINNTYSQNQAIMDDMFKGMKQSGGVYNPSPTAIAKMDQMYPPTAADSKVTTRADGKQMIGVDSSEAVAMREKTSANNQFAATMARVNARPNLTSVGAAGKPEGEMSPPLDLRSIAEEDRARESSPFKTGRDLLAGKAGLPPVTYSNPMLGILGGQEPTETAPAFDVKGENANFLNSLRGKNTPQQPSVAPPAVANQKGTTNKPQTPVFSPYQDQVSGMLAFGEDPEGWNFSKNRRGNYV